MIAFDTSTSTFLEGKVSGSFSPPAGSLVLAIFASAFPADVTDVTDSLAALTFTQLAEFLFGGDVRAELWAADCASAQSGMTITCTVADARCATGAIVVTGAKPKADQVAAPATIGSFSGNSSVTVVTSAAGSRVIGIVGSRGTSAPTVPAGQTQSFGGQTYLTPVVAAGNDYMYAQTTDADTPDASTSVTINTTGVAVEYAMLALEILAAADTPAPSILVPAHLAVGTLTAGITRS